MDIQSFRCKETRSIYEMRSANRFNSIRAVAERKLQMLDDAVELRNLKSPSGNRLEPLAGNRSGQHITRVNDQWRVCFVWGMNGLENVEIVDYH